jgi:hypothetical protein
MGQIKNNFESVACFQHEEMTSQGAAFTVQSTTTRPQKHHYENALSLEPPFENATASSAFRRTEADKKILD